MKNLYLFCVLVITSSTLFSQIRTNNPTGGTIGGHSAFLDASANLFSTSNNNGKGIAFPTTDLTVFTFNPSNGSSGSYPTAFHGFIVFNTATGTTPATGAGVGNQAVEPGFYYFNNPSPGFGFPLTAGQWIALGGGGGGGGAVTIVEDTPVPSALTTASGDVEQIIRLTGTADGTSTHIDLGTTTLAANTVKQFRKAVIYDSTDKLVLESTGDYNSVTNVFVTGNGMTNVLLPAGDYSVELYYTAN